MMMPPENPPLPQRIGVDARDLAGGTGTGIATYARALLRAIEAGGRDATLLVPGAPMPRPARWARAGWAGLQPLSGMERDAWQIRDVFRTAQVHFDLWRRPLRIAGPSEDPLAVMHWTSPLPLRCLGCPNVYTVHDLIPLRRPDLTGTDTVRYARMLRAVAQGADHLLAVSDSTKRDLIEFLPGCADRITALPQVVHLPAALRDADPAPVLHDRLGTIQPGGYFLFTGSIEPRKNIGRLIQAHEASGTSRPLLLLGPDGWRAETVLGPHLHRIGPPGSTAPVWRLQAVPRDAQLLLIKGARAVLYPSLAEGFGLPILEAMALGIPVLTSRGGATEEVAGGAALLVDPEDPAEIAQGIAALADDARIAVLATHGLHRAAWFAPDRYAASLGALYARLADGGLHTRIPG